jgi:hypothetical protein
VRTVGLCDTIKLGTRSKRNVSYRNRNLEHLGVTKLPVKKRICVQHCVDQILESEFNNKDISVVYDDGDALLILIYL